jgi:hypothetical protein
MSDFRFVYPMLAMVLLTFVVLIALFRSRIRAVREGHAPVSYFRVFQGSQEPEYAAKFSRHFTNLFEAPTLFYVACVAAIVVGVSSPVALGLAWAYVAARVVHALVHLGPNRIRHRLRAYFASWLILLALWVYVAIGAGQHS